MFLTIYNNEGIFDDSNTFGKRIKNARLMKHMTISELSILSGISVATLSYAENERKSLSLPYYRKLSEALKKPVSYLGCFEKLPAKELNQKITKARLYLGLTKKEFGQLIGVNEKTVAAWENNKQQPTEINLKLLKPYLRILKQSS